jgi:hypothetical protein
MREALMFQKKTLSHAISALTVSAITDKSFERLRGMARSSSEGQMTRLGYH